MLLALPGLSRLFVCCLLCLAYLVCLYVVCLFTQPLLGYEGALKNEIIERSRRGMLRDRRWVQTRAKALFQEWKREEARKPNRSNEDQRKIENMVFKASDGWYYRFLTRSGLESRRITCKKKMTLEQFKRKNQVWLPRARRMLREQWPGLVDDNGRFKPERLANIDEVPMQLVNSYNKQVMLYYFYILTFFFCVLIFAAHNPNIHTHRWMK